MHKLSLLDKILYQTYANSLSRWSNAAVGRAFDKWRLTSRYCLKVASNAFRLRLLGAGSVCPVPLGTDLSAVEYRLRNLEHLAKKFCVHRLEEQLGQAKAATQALTSTQAALFAARPRSSAPRHHEGRRYADQRPQKKTRDP